MAFCNKTAHGDHDCARQDDHGGECDCYDETCEWSNRYRFLKLPDYSSIIAEANKIVKLKPEYKTHEAQARPEMDRFMSRYGLKIALNCLISNLKDFQNILEDQEIGDTEYISKAIKDLEMTLYNYKNIDKE